MKLDFQEAAAAAGRTWTVRPRGGSSAPGGTNPAAAFAALVAGVAADTGVPQRPARLARQTQPDPAADGDPHTDDTESAPETAQPSPAPVKPGRGAKSLPTIAIVPPVVLWHDLRPQSSANDRKGHSSAARADDDPSDAGTTPASTTQPANHAAADAAALTTALAMTATPPAAAGATTPASTPPATSAAPDTATPSGSPVAPPAPASAASPATVGPRHTAAPGSDVSDDVEAAAQGAGTTAGIDPADASAEHGAAERTALRVSLPAAAMAAAARSDAPADARHASPNDSGRRDTKPSDLSTTPSASTPAARRMQDAVIGSVAAAAPAARNDAAPAPAINTVHTMTAPKAAAEIAASASAMLDVAPAGPLPDDSDLRNQIVQGIRMQWQDGMGDARFTLKPEYLGDVSVELRVEQGAVTAHVQAASPEVRAWVSAHESSLREGLAEHGLSLDTLVVADAPADKPDRDGRRRAPQNPQPPARAARRSRDADAFETLL